VLNRLHTIVKITFDIPDIANEMRNALNDFEKDIPDLKVLRNVVEHIDQYAIEDTKRHHKHISCKQLQVGRWDGSIFHWLDVELDVDRAKVASEKLFKSLHDIKKLYRLP
jgi:hypothetical protein